MPLTEGFPQSLTAFVVSESETIPLLTVHCIVPVHVTIGLGHVTYQCDRLPVCAEFDKGLSNLQTSSGHLRDSVQCHKLNLQLQYMHTYIANTWCAYQSVPMVCVPVPMARKSSPKLRNPFSISTRYSMAGVSLAVIIEKFAPTFVF